MRPPITPVFTTTLHGIMIDGVPLTKSVSRNLPSQTRRYVKRAEELLAKIKRKTWDDCMPHSTNNIPALAKARMMLALASPRPFPMSFAALHEPPMGRSQELAKDASDDSDDDEEDDSGNDDSDNGADSSDNGSFSGGGNYNPDEPRIPAGQPGGGQWTTGGTGTYRLRQYFC